MGVEMLSGDSSVNSNKLSNFTWLT
jgi:hypothetical protein